MNRKSRRAASSNSRRVVKAISKAAGTTEPTVDEKDPAFLALRVRALTDSINNLIKVQNENHPNILKAFSMVDAQQLVLIRIAHDLVDAVVAARKLQVDGDVTLARGDLGELKLQVDGTLDVEAYYAEYNQVGTEAGPDGEKAVALWGRGHSVSEAVDRAKLKTREPEKTTSDPDYQVEHFGGNSGQDHHQQDSSGAQASG